MTAQNQYMGVGVSVSDVEAFPTLSMNPLGLQDQQHHGHQVQYGHHHMMDPHSAGTAADQYTPQGGSVSPFDRSPHQQQGQGQNGFYAR